MTSKAETAASQSLRAILAPLTTGVDSASASAYEVSRFAEFIVLLRDRSP